MERESNFIENPSEGSEEQYVAIPEYENVVLDDEGTAHEDAYDPDRDGELDDVEKGDLMILDLARDPMLESQQIEATGELGSAEMEMIQEINSGLELRHRVLEDGEVAEAVDIAKRQTLEDALSVSDSKSPWVDSVKHQWGSFKKRAHAFALAGVAAMGVGMETAQAGGLGDILPPQERAQVEAQVRQEMGRHASEMNVGIPSRQRQNERYNEFQRSYSEQVTQANINYQRAITDLNIWAQNEIAALNASGRQAEIPAVQMEYQRHQQKMQRAYEADIQRIQARAQYSQEEVTHRNRVEQIISGAAGNAIYRIFAQ